MNNKQKKILIVRLDRIGDVVLSTPVIKAVRDAYPDSYIAFMARPHAFDILNGNPYLNEVIIYDKAGRENGLLGQLLFSKRLRGKKFDVAIVLHPSVRSHMTVFFAGIPERIGYDRKMGFLLTKKVPHTKQLGLKHESEYALGLLEYMSIYPDDKKLFMPINEKSELKVDKMFESLGIKKEDLVIAANPGASCASKRWAVEKFAKVMNRLVKELGAKIIVVSSADDKRHGDILTTLVNNNCINLSGKTTISELASVLKRSKLFISNDSGPVHIACAIGTPVIDIFGRCDRGLSPKRWGPLGEKNIVLHRDAGCEVCLAHNCKINFACLDLVTVDDVFAAAKNMLHK